MIKQPSAVSNSRTFLSSQEETSPVSSYSPFFPSSCPWQLLTYFCTYRFAYSGNFIQAEPQVMVCVWLLPLGDVPPAHVLQHQHCPRCPDGVRFHCRHTAHFPSPFFNSRALACFLFLATVNNAFMSVQAQGLG